MQNEIIINAELGETRVALLEDKQFAELHIERGRDKSVVGNVVKGKVSRVLPGMQAAFVDIGLEKAAFLYVGDYFESTLETGETAGEPSGGRRSRGRGRQAPPRIDTVLHEGKEIIVQIAKEPIGTKGARITSSISIPGRHLVLTPWSRRVGVSRRIGSDKERRRLREVVERLRPQNLGFIIRTAGDGVREEDLQADIRYLATVWAAIQQRHAEKSAPAILYSEHDLPLRIVRDLAGHETKRIVTDNKEIHESIRGFVDRFVADPKPSVDLYEDSNPIFERFDLEPQIHANLERKVWLKSGGSLVIDKSEALTAIDVNTGRFVGKRDLEETVFKTNLEAVQEVVHQLRFRNLGGLIIIDLIDMESAGNREKVYRALQEALRADKARTNILKISELGLVEMTRKRTRENLVQTLCEPCSHCEGRSYVLSRESVAFRVLREIKKHMPKLRGRSIAVTVNPHVAEELLSKSKPSMAALSLEIGHDIEVRARPAMHQEQYELSLLDEGPPAELALSWLNETHPDARGKDAEKEEGEGGSKRGRRRGRGGRGRGASDSDADQDAKAADTSDSASDNTDNTDNTDNEIAKVDDEKTASTPKRKRGSAIVAGNFERLDESSDAADEAKDLEVADVAVRDQQEAPARGRRGARTQKGPRAPIGSPEGPIRLSDEDRAAEIYERLDSDETESQPATPTTPTTPTKKADSDVDVADAEAAPAPKPARKRRARKTAPKKAAEESDSDALSNSPLGDETEVETVNGAASPAAPATPAETPNPAEAAETATAEASSAIKPRKTAPRKARAPKADAAETATEAKPDSGETPQTVDAEEESSIIPRSE